MPTIIKNAPINSSNPAVPNKPTFDFSVTCFSERLMKKVAIMAKIQIMAKTAIIPAMSGISVVESKLAEVNAFVSGVIP